MLINDSLLPRLPKVLLASSLLLSVVFTPIAAAQTAATPVIAAAVESAEVFEEVPLTGTVVSSRQARLSTEISGLIAALEVEIGDRVVAGDVILRLKSDLEQLALAAKQAEAEQARGELADAKRRLADAERLGRSNTVSANEINSLQAEVVIDTAEVSRLDAEQQQQRLRLQQHTLRAPFAGVISARTAERGEWVNPGQTVVELVSLQAPEIEFRVPQWAYPRLDDVARIEVRFDAIAGKRFGAAIDAVVPVTERSSRTFLVRARLADADVRLIPGLSASATMHIRNADNGVVVDRNALIRYPDGRVSVWVVQQDDDSTSVSEQQVQTGLSFDGRINITSGLKAGELVVVNGNESLREGQSVVVKQNIE